MKEIAALVRENADALAQVTQQAFLAGDALAVQRQPDQVAVRQCAQEQAVVPGTVRVVEVERHANAG